MTWLFDLDIHVHVAYGDVHIGPDGHSYPPGMLCCLDTGPMLRGIEQAQNPRWVIPTIFRFITYLLSSRSHTHSAYK